MCENYFHLKSRCLKKSIWPKRNFLLRSSYFCSFYSFDGQRIRERQRNVSMNWVSKSIIAFIPGSFQDSSSPERPWPMTNTHASERIKAKYCFCRENLLISLLLLNQISFIDSSSSSHLCLPVCLPLFSSYYWFFAF